jgi:hypothetical protein
LPPTIQRIAGSWRRRSASFTSSVSGEATENRLTQQTDKRMAAVLAGARVGEYIAGHRGKAERGVEFSVREQAGVGGDH